MSALGWSFVSSFFLLAVIVLRILWERNPQLNSTFRWPLVGVVVVCVLGILAVLGAEKQAKRTVEACWSQNQEVTIRFFRAGTYDVHFSAASPGDEGKLPGDFTLIANSSLKIKWPNKMPDSFCVSVSRNGKQELCQNLQKDI